ncbi:uncharacterized protein DUF402 [Diaminobutyricimonas aerilata]|uniref:Uncharacterized protein DUF402 n=1 Tax=Diaminobutyricimonas aerilata TaxID=1162967 RepID=A0A2M9CLA1_9MICO|nr:DUF402 domain-containing protein [Diaminobutyricimonas aerilata]PJJ72674.1 uncharacterized protein DUF402 [Diaminobutyricimonas aerilata]
MPETALIRWRHGDRISGAYPTHVITDTAEEVALWQPAGVVGWRSSGDRGGPRGRNMLPGGWDGAYEPHEWTGDGVLRVYRPGDPWSVWRWLGDDGWSSHFYVNLETPWRRTAIGFDSSDWYLDLVVGPDSWRFKDEDELEWATGAGILTAGQRARIDSAARDAVALVTRRGWPFDADWDRWSPLPRSLPPLPDDWADTRI